MCDAIFWHSRPIERCVDDSVVLDRGDVAGGGGAKVLPIRRSRGYVPMAWPMAEVGRRAVRRRGVEEYGGGGSGAGDYPQPAFGRFDGCAGLCCIFSGRLRIWCGCFMCRVQSIAHDLHPAYMSTQAVREAGGRVGRPPGGYSTMSDMPRRDGWNITWNGAGDCVRWHRVWHGRDDLGRGAAVVDGKEWSRAAGAEPMRLPGAMPRQITDGAARGCSIRRMGRGLRTHPEAVRLFPTRRIGGASGAMMAGVQHPVDEQHGSPV